MNHLPQTTRYRDDFHLTQITGQTTRSEAHPMLDRSARRRVSIEQPCNIPEIQGHSPSQVCDKRPLYLITSPEMIQEVLVTKQRD